MNERDYSLRKREDLAQKLIRVRITVYEIESKIGSEERSVNIWDVSYNIMWRILRPSGRSLRAFSQALKGKLGIPESIKLDQGEIITDHFTIAEKFNDFFITAVSKLKKSVKRNVNL